jgi:hypothetical protein
MSRLASGEPMNAMMTSHVRLSQGNQVSVSDWWVTFRLVSLLWRLPLLLRLYSLPALLQRLTTPLRSGSPPPLGLELEHVVRLVLRICEFRPFRSRLFPRTCLRQALALYSTLTNLGYTVSIHFGILRKGEELRGHSWVTVKGMPVVEGGDSSTYRIVYSYSSGQPNSGPNVKGSFSPNGQFF